MSLKNTDKKMLTVLIVAYEFPPMGSTGVQRIVSHFDSLSEDEIHRMEQAVQIAYGKDTSLEMACNII